jgi:hypothetical protein
LTDLRHGAATPGLGGILHSRNTKEANTESAKALHRLGTKAISALRRDGDAKFDAIREGPPNS